MKKVIKIKFIGTIEVKTGLHIGGGDDTSDIGAVDSLVIKGSDKMPIIPGSSLKGKLRYLLARMYSKGENEEIKEHNKDNNAIKQIFGATSMESRLQFVDCKVSDSYEKQDCLEIKKENTIKRNQKNKNSTARPRVIERVTAGTIFDVEIIYNTPIIESKDNIKKDEEIKKEIKKDMENLMNSIELLNLDYLGGNGTRGYGQIYLELNKMNCILVYKQGEDIKIEIKESEEIKEISYEKVEEIIAEIEKIEKSES